MADENPLSPLFRWRPNPGWIGDPAVVLDAVLSQVDTDQAKQVMMHYLDAATATQEANLRFLRGVRSAIASGAKK